MLVDAYSISSGFEKLVGNRIDPMKIKTTIQIDLHILLLFIK